MSSIATQIMEWAEARPEGTPIRVPALLHLGTPAAVRQSLARLVKRKKMTRVYPGIYMRRMEVPPRLKKMGFGMAMPAEHLMMQGLAKLWGEAIVPTGAAAANFMGRCEQNVIRSVYWTTGPNRNVWWAHHRIELQHKPAWLLTAAHTRAGKAMRALVWLCDPWREETESELEKVIPQLSAEEREEFAELQVVMPEWLAVPVSRYLSNA